jgi:hypothetical protein
MKDIDLAVTASKRIESALVRIYGARGKGLHEKAGSVERKLGLALTKRIRYVATIRNKLIHEESYRKIDDRASFKKAVKHINKELSKMEKSGISWQMIAMIIVLVLIFGVLAAMFLRLI